MILLKLSQCLHKRTYIKCTISTLPSIVTCCKQVVLAAYFFQTLNVAISFTNSVMATLQEGDKEMPEGGMSIEEIELEKQLLKVHYYNHVMSHNIYLFIYLDSALFTNKYALMCYNISADHYSLLAY